MTEASTKFSKSKIIYSTLLPRADIPSHIITNINDQLINGCSKLPNVHLVTHTNVFSKGLEALHDDKHLKRRHIGLFAANLVTRSVAEQDLQPGDPRPVMIICPAKRPSLNQHHLRITHPTVMLSRTFAIVAIVLYRPNE